jgi:hypothetical protein
MNRELQDFLKLPEELEHAIDWNAANALFRYYTSEQYATTGGSSSWKAKSYYALKPFLPRSLQLWLRRRYTRIQETTPFPHWPVEPVLSDTVKRLLQEVGAASGLSELPHLGFWPGEKQWALVLTHDVEGVEGIRNISRIAALEERYGFRSSWNFVPRRYPFDRSIIDDLKSRGFEIGVHGLYHDGLLFKSLETFQERLPAIHDYARQWSAAGFRSPATHRRYEWMDQLRFAYDSSFPDTDIYEPNAGGCCWVFPFFIGNLLEIPITLPQDHTLLEILRKGDFRMWYEKVRWIQAQGGLAVLILHPDYVLTDQRMALYEEFLRAMQQEAGVWKALPSTVAAWWQSRHQSRVVQQEGNYTIVGPAAGQGSIVRISVTG